MIFTPLSLQGVYEITPKVFSDERGMFYRFFCEDEFKEIGHTKPWIQVNHSYTEKAATIRGMHFQLPPHSEIKMVKCIAGKILDVVVDVRHGSDTFLHWTGVELSAENKKSLYIPEGFAHGFQTLTDNCELIYFHTANYKPEQESALNYNDPKINIKWPLPPAMVSDRDSKHPFIQDDFSGVKLK